MALSEHEQRMLDEIEETLVRNDSQLGMVLLFSDGRRRFGGLSGLAACLVGLGLLSLGVVARNGAGTIVAVVGFVLIVVGCETCIAGMRRFSQRYPLRRAK